MAEENKEVGNPRLNVWQQTSAPRHLERLPDDARSPSWFAIRQTTTTGRRAPFETRKRTASRS